MKKIEVLEKPVSLEILTEKSLFPEHKSALNIPLTSSEYSVYDYYLNQAENTHTSIKPYVYNEVNAFIDLDSQKNKLTQPKTTWFGRKLLNEHMANVRGKDFWFTIDPIVDLQVGSDSEDINTFNNTRGIQINGGLGKNFNFSTSFLPIPFPL